MIMAKSVGIRFVSIMHATCMGDLLILLNFLRMKTVCLNDTPGECIYKHLLKAEAIGCS